MRDIEADSITMCGCSADWFASRLAAIEGTGILNVTGQCADNIGSSGTAFIGSCS